MTHLPSQGRSALTPCTAAAFLRTAADFINRSVPLAEGRVVAVTLCCPEKEHQHIKGIPAAYRGTATCSITRQLVTSPWGKRVIYYRGPEREKVCLLKVNMWRGDGVWPLNSTGGETKKSAYVHMCSTGRCSYKVRYVLRWVDFDLGGKRRMCARVRQSVCRDERGEPPTNGSAVDHQICSMGKPSLFVVSHRMQQLRLCHKKRPLPALRTTS